MGRRVVLGAGGVGRQGQEQGPWGSHAGVSEGGGRVWGYGGMLESDFQVIEFKCSPFPLTVIRTLPRSGVGCSSSRVGIAQRVRPCPTTTNLQRCITLTLILTLYPNFQPNPYP